MVCPYTEGAKTKMIWQSSTRTVREALLFRV
jgi:hypothetical protein